MTKLDKLLDVVMEFFLEEKEMLFQFLKQRIIENKRELIALDTQTSLQEYKDGKYQLFTTERSYQ